MVLIVVLALLSSLAYGTSDFLGGLAARRLSVLPATGVTYFFGTAVVGLALLLGGSTWSTDALVAGSAAAVFAVVGFITFYAALAIGPMSLLSPAIALVYAIVPVVASVLLGEGLRPLGWFAVGLAVVATLLISVQRSGAPARVTPAGVVLGLISGVCLGASIIALDSAPADSGLSPAFVEMAGGVVVLLLVTGALRMLRLRPAWLAAAPVAADEGAGERTRSRRRAWIGAIVAGVLLGGANALLMTALHLGNLAVVSVLSSLYPLATVLLAAIVLRERVSRLQVGGIALAIVAVVLLSFS